MAMIPYPELVAALSSWRARKGLPTEQRSEYLATAAPAAAYAAMPFSAPPRAAAAAPPMAAPDYGTLDDDDAIDDGELDIVAEEDDHLQDASGMIGDRAATDAAGVDDENTAIAGGYDEDAYEGVDAGAATMDADDDIDDELESGEIDRGTPPPLAPPPGDDDGDDNPWK